VEDNPVSPYDNLFGRSGAMMGPNVSPGERPPSGEEQLEEFLRELVHGLRNSLQALHLTVSLLARHAQSVASPAIEQDIERMRRLREEMDRMLGDATTYRRLRSAPLAPKWVDMNALLGRIQLSTPLRDSDRIEIDGNLPLLWTDESLALMIFESLARNGLQYNLQEQRRIVVSAQMLDEESGRWRFDLRDNGVGIDPTYHEKIFQPFQRMTTLEGEGTGMGLFLARQAARRLGGTVEVGEVSEDGSTLNVVIEEGRDRPPLPKE